jgi:hypothetical protein
MNATSVMCRVLADAIGRTPQALVAGLHWPGLRGRRCRKIKLGVGMIVFLSGINRSKANEAVFHLTLAYSDSLG